VFGGGISLNILSQLELFIRERTCFLWGRNPSFRHVCDFDECNFSI